METWAEDWLTCLAEVWFDGIYEILFGGRAEFRFCGSSGAWLSGSWSGSITLLSCIASVGSYSSSKSLEAEIFPFLEAAFAVWGFIIISSLENSPESKYKEKPMIETALNLRSLSTLSKSGLFKIYVNIDTKALPNNEFELTWINEAWYPFSSSFFTSSLPLSDR